MKLLTILSVLYMPVSGGIDFVFIEYITGTVSSVNLAIIRTFIMAAMFLSVHRIVRGPLRVSRQDIPRFLAAGGAGLGTYAILEATGISMVSASVSSLILSGVTVMATVGDSLINKVPLTRLKAMCVLASEAGVAVIVFGAVDSEASGSLLGVAVLLAATVLFAMYLLLVKPLHGSYSTLTVMTGVFTSAALVDIPVFLCYHSAEILKIQPGQWGVIFLFTVLCFALTQLLYMFAVRELSVVFCSMVLNLMPLVAIAVSLITFGVTPRPAQLFGGAILIAAVAAVSYHEK